MGKAIIIKGANFADNALGIMENVELRRLGTMRSLWPNSDRTIPNGTFGFLNDTDGYITSFAIYSDGNAKVAVRVYREGIKVSESEAVYTGNTSAAVTEHNISPIEVKSGDIICMFMDPETPNMVRYASTGGDVDTYSTTSLDANRRILAYNFHITHWTD